MIKKIQIACGRFLVNGIPFSDLSDVNNFRFAETNYKEKESERDLGNKGQLQPLNEHEDNAAKSLRLQYVLQTESPKISLPLRLRYKQNDRKTLYFQLTLCNLKFILI